MSFFEAIMLICFGAAWPASIYRSYVSKSIKGKSLLFLLIIEIGYIAGIIHKILYSPDLVIYLYFLNLFMVAIDIGLYFRNRHITKQESNTN
jgi:hypothetical protein